MRTALDQENQKVFAVDATKFSNYRCPYCEEEVRFRKGGKNEPHFAHLPDSTCPFRDDADSMSEWHCRMQDYFPKDKQEFLFIDDETGEKHRADVFLGESNTVLEFQHSPISEAEFLSRTNFHLKNGRRIVWLFDESTSKENGNFGKFRRAEELCQDEIEIYRWMYRRRYFLNNFPDLKRYNDQYSVCVYTGTCGDVFYRIADQIEDYKYVRFTPEPIKMTPNIDSELFFRHDPWWAVEDSIEMANRIQELNRQQPRNTPYYPFRRIGPRKGRL